VAAVPELLAAAPGPAVSGRAAVREPAPDRPAASLRAAATLAVQPLAAAEQPGRASRFPRRREPSPVRSALPRPALSELRRSRLRAVR